MGDRDLQRERHALLATLIQMDQRLAALQVELVKEQEDVAQVRRQMQGSLHQLAKAELEIQLRQAADVARRLQSELAKRSDLEKQLAVLDRALADDPIQRAREAAATKAVSDIDAMSARGKGEQLMELAARIEAIDIELLPLTSALQAGHEAVSSLAAAQARPQKPSHDEALAKALAFYAVLAELPAPDDASPRIVDAVEMGDRAAYDGDVFERFARLRLLGERVRTRHTEVAQRRLAFEAQRTKLRSS